MANSSSSYFFLWLCSAFAFIFHPLADTLAMTHSSKKRERKKKTTRMVKAHINEWSLYIHAHWKEKEQKKYAKNRTNP